MTRFDVAWAVLVTATLVSFWTGVDHAGDVAAVIVIAVAFAKVRIIGTHFMGLSSAPVALARAFDAYAAVVALTLVVLYFAV